MGGMENNGWKKIDLESTRWDITPFRNQLDPTRSGPRPEQDGSSPGLAHARCTSLSPINKQTRGWRSICPCRGLVFSLTRRRISGSLWAAQECDKNGEERCQPA